MKSIVQSDATSPWIHQAPRALVDVGVRTLYRDMTVLKTRISRVHSLYDDCCQVFLRLLHPRVRDLPRRMDRGRVGYNRSQETETIQGHLEQKPVEFGGGPT